MYHTMVNHLEFYTIQLYCRTHENEVQSLIELCAIRDGLSTCNTLSHADVCHLNELISLE